MDSDSSEKFDKNTYTFGTLRQVGKAVESWSIFKISLVIQKDTLRSFALLVPVLMLAAIPPGLVFADRWLHALHPDIFRGFWCQSPFLCQTLLPSYYFAFVCAILLLLVMLFRWQSSLIIVEEALVANERVAVDPRQAHYGLLLLIASAWGFVGVILLSLANKQYPGWDLVLTWLIFIAGWFLRAIPFNSFVNFWKQDGEFWVALLLAHFSLVAVLVGYFGQPQYFYATLVLLGTAGLNLWRFRRRVPLIFWIISLALVVYTINVNAWWVAVIGDDYNFHEFSWKLSGQTSFIELGKVLFKVDGAHGIHPYLSSFLQAIPMIFLGHENFSWRFSTLYLTAIDVGLFYVFAKSFLGKHVALIAAFFLAVSHYIMSFGKIGYNNLQALFALNLALALTVWALRARHHLSFACLGSVLALCFYLFPAALYVIPLALFLLLLYYPPFSRSALERWFVMLVVAAALIYPLLFQPIYWQRKVEGTLFNRPDLVQSLGTIFTHFATNFVYSFFSFLYIPIESHFVSSSYLDPISGAFALIGMCVFVYQIRRQKFALFWGLGFLAFLFIVGASHDREAPPNTRMFLLLPWFVLFATWGLLWLGKRLTGLGLSRLLSSWILLPLFFIGIASVNLYQAYQLSYVRYACDNQVESLFIRVSQNVYAAEPHTPKNYAIITDEAWGIEGLQEFQNVYPHLAWAQLHPVRITEAALPASSLALLAERNTIVIISPFMELEWQAALDAPLREMGKESCLVTAVDGIKRFTLYHAPDLPQACPSDLE